VGAALRKRQIAANIKAGRALGLSRIVGDQREAVEPGGGGDDRIGRAYGLAGSAQFSPHARRFIQHDVVDGQHDESAQIGSASASVAKTAKNSTTAMRGR
jgi:hypothetical protein